MSRRAASRTGWMAAFCLVWLASGASAKEIVAVRVGNHPQFTRVVFELDEAAGYRIERRAAEGGADEILVTLGAGSSLRSVTQRTVMVESVAVEEGRGETVARIRLKKSPSRVKELILANPPRIVFDLVLPESMLAARRAEAEAKAAEAAKPEAEPKIAKPAVAPKPEPSPEPKIAKPKPRPEPKIAKPEVAPKPEPKVAKPEVAPKPEPKVAKPEVAPKPELKVAKPEVAPKPEPKVARPEVAPKPEFGPKPAPRPEPKIARPVPEREVAKPEVAKAKPAASGNTSLWLGIAAGVLVILIGATLLMRRRSQPGDLDVTALADEEYDEDAGAIPSEGFAMGDAEATIASPTPGISQPVGPPAAASSGPDITAGPGLFDDEPEKEGETMDSESHDLPTQHTASEMPTQLAGGAAGGDVMRLARELERRVAQLESRLDEQVDARERLERQVTAQAEELRVQRAAIARTQRALRSVNRGEEEQATEPALRDPSKTV